MLYRLWAFGSSSVLLGMGDGPPKDGARSCSDELAAALSFSMRINFQ